MKILLFTLAWLVLAMPVFASSSADWSSSLPSVAIGIIGIITAIIVVVGRYVKLGAVGSTARKIHEDVITFERIDKAVEELLSRGRPPTPFVDWVGDVVASIIVYAPNWSDMSTEQKIEIISNLFAKLSFTKAKRLLPASDDRVLKEQFAKQRLASRVIEKSNDVINLSKGGS